MFRLRHMLTFAAAAVMIAATSSAALAAPMRLKQDTNVFEGPDLSAAVKYYLKAGEVHDVNCGSIGWCFVDTPVGGGYIPGAVVEAAPGQPPAGGGGNNFPGFSFDFNLGGGNNNPPPRPGRPPRPRFDEVCFYTSSNFRGRSFCAEPGDSANRLPSDWNDAISSIEVIGDAEVEVCTDRNLRGTCRTITRDTNRLPGSVNDRISSFEIY